MAILVNCNLSKYTFVATTAKVVYAGLVAQLERCMRRGARQLPLESFSKAGKTSSVPVTCSGQELTGSPIEDVACCVYHG